MSRITSHLAWSAKSTRAGEAYLYAPSAAGRWDGDDAGNEWFCGYAIYRDSDGYYLYEDDGSGNGDAIGDYATVWEAALAANAHDVNPLAAVDRWMPREAVAS